MISLELSTIQLQLRKQDNKTQVYDPIRRKWLVLTPEEHVRQLLLQYLIHTMNYPTSLIAVEKQISFGSMVKRFDIAVYNRNHQPWMLIECKAPEITITENALNQLLQYHNILQCSYWLLSNGHQHLCADATNTAAIKWLSDLPAYNF